MSCYQRASITTHEQHPARARFRLPFRKSHFQPYIHSRIMSLAPGTPDHPTSKSGTLTPGGVADQFARLDLPAPSELKLNLPQTNSGSKAPSPLADAGNVFSTDTGDISGPEPEAITEARRKTRTESMSAELSDALSKMNLPQPERIFGPNEGGSFASREVNKGKQGVSAEDWDNAGIQDEVPEAVKEPTRMTHSRNASKA